VCSSVLAPLAEGLPCAHHTQSLIVCRATGELMDPDNPPCMLPNGHVYSRRGSYPAALSLWMHACVCALTCMCVLPCVRVRSGAGGARRHCDRSVDARAVSIGRRAQNLCVVSELVVRGVVLLSVQTWVLPS
jgi:hypothetical protein